MKRKPIPVEVIEEIIAERPYICELCGTALNTAQNTERQRQLHHITPRRSGGNNKKENLALVCKKCHDMMESMIYFAEMKWRGEVAIRIKELKVILHEIQV